MHGKIKDHSMDQKINMPGPASYDKNNAHVISKLKNAGNRRFGK